MSETLIWAGIGLAIASWALSRAWQPDTPDAGWRGRDSLALGAGALAIAVVVALALGMLS